MANKEEFVQYSIFKSFKNLVAFTTTKQTLNVINPRFTGDSAKRYERNRELLAGKLGISSKQLVFPRQTHTNCVADISGVPETELRETDALISNETGICLCVQTADCVPVLLFDPIENVIAVVHAGWRGTVHKIAENAVQKMISDYRCKAKNIIAAIGPSIGPEVYEVGNEVVQSVRNTFQNPEKLLIQNNSGKYHFNLWEANRQILIDNQIEVENIEVFGECSYSHPEKYYSARKQGSKTGRMVSGILLNP